ncbi:DUF5671 domain-containing protein [Paeniglutamicibacter cryotolerans]|uniref:DUF5671 domain-containing protein n=1 Tax=Paeniglutamicibacter cryotolerans TaxID=670079 RepID=A0A839QN93_9MICC|nr:DUF5671 domain-containing protein [Paeniglutamicibacter cryotolerans]MBB2996095.1 hypothetical protein [Paeniglutamicibacter cryotolerans]
MSATTVQRTGGALPTVRRITVYVLLFALVSLTAAGTSGLIAIVLGGSTENRGSALAQSLAFVLVAGPLSWLLWRSLAKRLLEPAEHTAPAWGLYVAALYTAALIVASISLLSVLADVITGHPGPWQERVGLALAWGAVWWWQARLWHHPRRAPQTLATLPGILGNWYGLALAWGALAAALASLFTAAIASLASAAAFGTPWFTAPLAQLPWLAGGLLIWWWHFARERVGVLRGGFADVALVVGGVLVAAAATLGGCGVTIHALLRFAFGSGMPALQVIPAALATALSGALVWAFHHKVLRESLAPVRTAARLVLSGIGLAAAASGLGIVINAALAGSSRQLSGYTAGDLLLAGLVSLVLGAALWVPAWRPDRAADPRGRRVYLVAVFGISAAVALVALLVIGFRIFEHLFDAANADSGLLESVRAPLGLLVATVLAAGYHFIIWGGDRAVLDTEISEHPGTLESLVLVAGGDTAGLRQLLVRLTGARVEVMAVAGVPGVPPPDEAALASALAGIGPAARRVMLLIDGPTELRIIELEQSSR